MADINVGDQLELESVTGKKTVEVMEVDIVKGEIVVESQGTQTFYLIEDGLNVRDKDGNCVVESVVATKVTGRMPLTEAEKLTKA